MLPPPDAQDLARSRARLERLATLLDEAFVVPGTSLRVGIEPLLGLVPVVGDVAGLAIGGWFVAEALRLGAPPELVRRMVGNLVVDAAVGAVPLAGDLFDFAFKAHRRNAALLGAHLDRLEGRAPSRTARLKQPRWIAAALAVAAAAIAAALWWR